MTKANEDVSYSVSRCEIVRDAVKVPVKRLRDRVLSTEYDTGRGSQTLSWLR